MAAHIYRVYKVKLIHISIGVNVNKPSRRGLIQKINVSTGVLAVLLVLFLLTLSFSLTTAIAESPRVVNTLYAGFKAIDKYSYGDVVIDVVYLNPRIYYAYRNSLVVPSKDTYMPPDQSIE